MLQSMLIRFLLGYVMIATIFARPLLKDNKKRLSGIIELEDVQLSESGMFPVGTNALLAIYI